MTPTTRSERSASGFFRGVIMTEAERKAECKCIAHEVKALADGYHGRLRDLYRDGYSVTVRTFHADDTQVLVRHDVAAVAEPRAKAGSLYRADVEATEARNAD